MNTIGHLYRLTTFGESHGLSIGGIIDGCPAGVRIDFDFIQSELDRRKPGQSTITTQRNEWDKVEFLSGIFEGKTTGSSIGFIIQNKDQQSKDYNHLKDTFRPSHGELFKTKDGHQVTFAIGSDKHFILLCKLLKLDALIHSTKYQSNQLRVKKFSIGCNVRI